MAFGPTGARINGRTALDAVLALINGIFAVV